MNAHPMCSVIVAEARRWIGTPYCHQASVIGQGCDCLGLIRGVWRSLIGTEPENLPPYSPDWGEVSGKENVLETSGRYLEPVGLDEAAGGDVIVFRWRPGMIAKHMGILTGPARFIHAWQRAGVAEVALVPSWRSRMVAAYRFPGFGND